MSPRFLAKGADRQETGLLLEGERAKETRICIYICIHQTIGFITMVTQCSVPQRPHKQKNPTVGFEGPSQGEPKHHGL